MIATQLRAELELRAGVHLAAAQFAADPDQLRIATLIGAAARVAASHGVAGVEGYLAAMADLGPDRDRVASDAIRDALDATIVRDAADAWLGRPGAASATIASAA